MHPQHVSPEESVEIHKEIRSKFSLGVHWGTFKQMGCFEVIFFFFITGIIAPFSFHLKQTKEEKSRQ